MRITAVTCVKNEGPFLIEWIAFNRVIGVTDFLFYSNDCTDATDRLLDALEARGIVTHLPNPAEGRNYQMEALKHAKSQPVVREADWVWIADVDEFLNIHVGEGTIPELIEACGNPHAISVTFQFFANCGIDEFVDAPVIGQFTRSHNPDIWCDQTAIEVKTLIRNDFTEAFKKCDAILAPVTPTPAYRLGEKTDDPLKMYLDDILTTPVNLAGNCALSLPCGFSSDGLPIGLQIIGDAFREETILKVGHAYEQTTEWHTRKPEIS